MTDEKQELDPAGDILEQIEFPTPTEQDESPVDVDNKVVKEEPNIPDMTDPGWSEYVLSQFEQDELLEGNPTVDGLRRVTTRLLGPIVESRSHVIQAPNPANDGRATVEHTIVIWWELDDRGDGIDKRRLFQDCADVYELNTNLEYARYATATAATRAEGRALRKALQLKRVVAAEEISDNPVEKPGKITRGQISFMNMMCHSDRLDINVIKLINMGKKNAEDMYKSIEDVPYPTAVKMNQYLTECQTGKTADGKVRVIPDAIKGYDPDWRKEE